MDASIWLDLRHLNYFARCNRLDGAGRLLLHDSPYLVERAGTTVASSEGFPRQQIHYALNHWLHLHLPVSLHGNNHGVRYTYCHLRSLWCNLWKRDSVSVKQLTNKFNLDITKLETVQFFKQFKFNKQLHDEYSHTTYVYTLYKKTGVVIMESFYDQRPKPVMNKYVMIICMDENTDRKIINIKVF